MLLKIKPENRLVFIFSNSHIALKGMWQYKRAKFRYVTKNRTFFHCAPLFSSIFSNVSKFSPYNIAPVPSMQTCNMCWFIYQTQLHRWLSPNCKAPLHHIQVHASGEVIKLEKFCPWKGHLFALEASLSISPTIKYALYQESNSTKWRVQVNRAIFRNVTTNGNMFTLLHCVLLLNISKLRNVTKNGNLLYCATHLNLEMLLKMETYYTVQHI